MSDKNKEKPVQELEEGYKKSQFRETLEVLFYGLALLIFFKTFVFQNFQIPTASMENTLLIGDHITANTFVFKNSSKLDKALFPFRPIRRGDVIVFKYPGDVKQDWIKRCVGIPGDQFAVRKHRVYINDELLDERYPFFKKHRSQPGTTDDRDRNNRYYPLGYEESKSGFENREYLPRSLENVTFEAMRRRSMVTLRHFKEMGADPQIFDDVMARLQASPSGVIPEGFYFMMGDNRNNSHDSRTWGLVPEELIHGRAWFVWWSYGEDADSHTLTGKEKVMNYLQLVKTFWTRTHWKESFSFIK